MPSEIGMCTKPRSGPYCVKQHPGTAYVLRMRQMKQKGLLATMRLPFFLLFIGALVAESHGKECHFQYAKCIYATGQAVTKLSMNLVRQPLVNSHILS